MAESSTKTKLFVESAGVEWRRLEDGPDKGCISYSPSPRAGVSAVSVQRLLAGLAEINSAGLLRVKSRGVLNGREVLLFEGFAGVPIRADLLPMPMDAFISLAMELTAALAQIHTAGYVHNYVCPDAFLYSSQNGEAKLFRFEYLRQISEGQLQNRRPVSDPRYLPFTSPEGTGRTGIGIDVRSDLYSLGAVFYYLIAGSPPFPALDLLGTIHSHIAVRPRDPVELNKAVPKEIAAVVLKLLAKEPGDRYQGNFGLLKDLEYIQERVVRRDSFEPACGFRPGSFDRRAVFSVPKEIVGRERQLEDIEAAAQPKGNSGNSVLISGRSGSGKTALIRAAAAKLFPIVGGRDLFGKFDAVVQSPYQAILQALSEFASGVLSESASSIESWRSRILNATPIGARLFSELVPEFANLVGDLPELEPLAPSERDNRFKLVLHDLLAGLASSEHPIRLWLDDVQWADGASREAIAYLLQTGGVPNMTVVCTVRDFSGQEHAETASFVASLRKMPSQRCEIKLDWLRPADIHVLLRDSFRVVEAGIEGEWRSIDNELPSTFSKVVFDKTEGSPLFVHELLESLRQKRAFWYDEMLGAWHWDVDVVRRMSVSGGVAPFLRRKLLGMSAEGQKVLGFASCTERDFQLTQLEAISSFDKNKTGKALKEAEDLRLIYELPGRELTWNFAHDQIKESVYRSLSEEEKSYCHYRLGRSYMLIVKHEQQESLLFQAMNQLLLGKAHIKLSEAKDFVATAIAASAIAKTTAAYDSALRYLEAIRSFFGEENWDTNYDEMLSYELAYLEALYLNRKFREADSAMDSMLSTVKDSVDRSKIYQLRVLSHSFLMDYDAAIEAGLEGLKDLGFTISKNRYVALAAELARMPIVERRIDIHHLDAQPPISDERAGAALKLLFAVTPATFLKDKILSLALGLRMFRVAVKYGVDAYGLYGASSVSLVYAVVFKNYRKAWNIADSLLGVREKYPADSTFNANFLLAYATVLLWPKTPYEELIPLIEEGFASSKRAAYVTFIGYFADILLQFNVYMGRSVDLLAERRVEYEPLSRQLSFRELDVTLEITGRFVHHMREKGAEDGRMLLQEEDVQLENYVGDILEKGFFYMDYLILALVFGDRDLGQRCVSILESLWEFTNAGYHRAEYLMLASMDMAAAMSVRGDRRDIGKIRRYRRELAKLAALGPKAHRHRLLIVDAELALLDRDIVIAGHLFQEALEACQENKTFHIAGIVAERAAQLYLTADLRRQHDDYISVAYECFRDYGATGKTGALRVLYPSVLSNIESGPGSDEVLRLGAIDFEAVVKASSALFEEIEMEQLVNRLLVLSIETAGATRGCIFLGSDEGEEKLASEGFVIDGDIQIVESEDMLPDSLQGNYSFVHAIVRTVGRTESAVIINDVQKDGRFSSVVQESLMRDQSGSARSVLCLPIVDRGQTHATMYLENHLTSAAFTGERIKVLEVLLSLAAISMTNVRLYAQQDSALRLERSARERLVKLNSLKDEFLANTSHELRTPLNGIIGLADSMLSGDYGALSDASKANLSLIVGSGRRLSSLVNDILDFTRLEKRELEIHPRSVDIEAMVSLVCRLLRADAHRLGNKRLVTDVPPNLAPVWVDENRFQQILFNLIGNAIKFSESEGTIRIEAEEHTAFATIRVIDNGIGIPAGKLDQIFVVFEQVDGSSERKASGTGLGLPLAKRLVELHGGEIEITSELGVGSVCSFTLPLSGADADELDIVKVSKLAQEETRVEEVALIDSQRVNVKSGRESTYHVLVVDDEPINLSILENYLRSGGYTVTSATSGAEALRLLEDGLEPGIVMLDVMMPKMNGYETCRQIRRNSNAVELPIILLTAKNRIEDLEAGFDSGANDYITKPFARQELLARTRTHLDLSKMSIAFSRFVPLEIARFLNKDSILDIRLGDSVQMETTVMFLDIRSYTMLAEGMTPRETFAFLITLFQRIGPIVENCGGLINQYLGDGFMALFPESPDDAVAAAIRIQKEIKRFNADRLGEEKAPIDVGIGIHTGDVIFGIIGDRFRRSGNVISDTVNLTARVEGLTKIYGARIAATGATLKRVKYVDTDGYRLLDEVRVKGRKEPVKVSEIFVGDDDEQVNLKRVTRNQFEEAIGLYQAERFVEAKQLFAEILSRNPFDRGAELLLGRCAHYETHGAPMDWDGIADLPEK